mmetsp:Transcript_141759/g.395240  ORF Transcript_141759/g.395240 Transcript_141759/m.395240 type:complete len:214 (+) Transcript_141759:535-1176(+)
MLSLILLRSSSWLLSFSFWPSISETSWLRESRVCFKSCTVDSITFNFWLKDATRSVSVLSNPSRRPTSAFRRPSVSVSWATCCRRSDSVVCRPAVTASSFAMSSFSLSIVTLRPEKFVAKSSTVKVPQLAPFGPTRNNGSSQPLFCPCTKLLRLTEQEATIVSCPTSESHKMKFTTSDSGSLTLKSNSAFQTGFRFPWSISVCRCCPEISTTT